MRLDEGVDKGSLRHGDDEYSSRKSRVMIDKEVCKLNKWNEVSDPRS